MKLRIKGDESPNAIFRGLEEITLDADVAVLFFSVKNIVFASVMRCYLAAICQHPPKRVGRDRSVGIATRYGLEGSGIESRWGTRFSAPVHNPEAHPATQPLIQGVLGLSRG